MIANSRNKIALGTLILISLLIFFGCNEQTNKSANQETSFIGFANPAAVYCEKVMGYSYEIRDTDKGQIGICILPDNTECDEWEFLEGKCGQESSYCEKQGFETKVKKDGKNPFSKEYSVCVKKEKKLGKEGAEITEETEIGSVTELTDLKEKSKIKKPKE